MEEENIDFSKEEDKEERKPHKGGIILRFEPTNTRELMASPITVTSFKHFGCFDFCMMVQRVQSHLLLTRVFISNIEDNQVTLVGVTFTISSDIMFATNGIPNVGEMWFKAQNLNHKYYKPYLKPWYRNERKGFLPFSHLLGTYAPMMKIIMEYFTCEGRFSRLYSYHIRLLMHFTRVKMLNIPYNFFRRIEKWHT